MAASTGGGGDEQACGRGRTNRGYVDGAEAWPLSQLPYLATPLSLSLYSSFLALYGYVRTLYTEQMLSRPFKRHR